MKRRRCYRIALAIAFLFTVVFTCFFYIYNVKSDIPDSIKIFAGNDSRFDFSMPVEAELQAHSEVLSIDNSHTDYEGNIHFSLDKPFTVSSSHTGNYKMNLKLFGLFDLKNIELDVIENQNVIPCGKTIGIQMKTDGLLVLGTGKVKDVSGNEYEPAYQILMTGDYITGIENEKVESIEAFIDRLNECTSGVVTLKIRRNNKESKVKLNIIDCEDGNRKIGVWVREDTQGIGTLTCVDNKGRFAALGHGITDSDAGVLMELKSGGIYDADVINVVKGKEGTPGEIMGIILESENNRLANIKKNTTLGISGKITEKYKQELMLSNVKSYPIALRQDIKKGAAKIMCQIGENIKTYDVEITDIDRGSMDNKGLVIKVTDDELLEKTGGIVQGMSGSPILQNGRMIGAVTHVFVNDPTKGYGIFIENMLEH